MLNGHRVPSQLRSSPPAVTPLLWTSTKPEALDDEDTMMPRPSMVPRRASLLSGCDRDEFKVETMDESQHSVSMDETSQSPPQVVDLTVKSPVFSHLNAFVKSEPSPQFPTLFENESQQFMGPPPSKVREFSVDNFPGREVKEARVRSGSFSHSSSLHDSMGFESISRVRSSSMSHARPSVFTQDVQTQLSSGVKQAAQELQVSF